MMKVLRIDGRAEARPLGGYHASTVHVGRVERVCTRTCASVHFPCYARGGKRRIYKQTKITFHCRKGPSYLLSAYDTQSPRDSHHLPDPCANHNSVIMNTNTNNTAAGGQKEDYLDKGLDAAEKKFGGSLGQDTQKNRGVNEQIVCPLPCALTLLGGESRRIEANNRHRPMAHATCLKRPRGKTSRTSSPTRPLDTQAPKGQDGSKSDGKADDGSSDTEEQLKQNQGFWSKLDESWNRKVRPVVERMNGWM